MAWQEDGRERQSPAKAVFRPIGREGACLWYWEAIKPYRSLAGLTGRFTAVLQAEGQHLCPAPHSNKQTAGNQSRLMIAENLAGWGTETPPRPIGTPGQDRTPHKP